MQFKRKTLKQKENRSALLFVILPFIGLMIFTGFPLIFSSFYSFTKQNANSTNLLDVTFIGFAHYGAILSDPEFYKSVGFSFLYAVGTSLLQTVLSLVLAYFLSKPIKGRTAIRIILFIPYVCSVVAMSFIWQSMLDDNFGLLNSWLVSMGGDPISWLKDDRTSMLIMIIISVWGGLGYGTILYSAALSTVDNSLYEACDVMGASSFRKFMKITIPSISPTTFYLLVMGMIGNLQAFTNFQIMNPTFQGSQMKTMVYYVYSYAFEMDASNYGLTYASAAGWVTGIIVIIFTVIMFKTQKYWVHYES
jgi:multiple sugar transport system permease protein